MAELLKFFFFSSLTFVVYQRNVNIKHRSLPLCSLNFEPTYFTSAWNVSDKMIPT